MAKSKGGKTGSKTGSESVVKKGSIKVVSVPVGLRKKNDIKLFGRPIGLRKKNDIILLGMLSLSIVVLVLVISIIYVSIPTIKKKYKQMKQIRLSKQFMNSIFGNVVSTSNADSPPALQLMISQLKVDYTSSNPSENLIKQAALTKQTKIPDKISRAITRDRKSVV